MAVETRVIAPVIPGDLLTCEAPAPQDIAMDSDVADYLVQLYAAAAECVRKIDAVREALNSTNP